MADKKMGVLPAAFERYRSGPLKFDFIRSQGILKEVRVWVDFPSDHLRVVFEEPRIQPMHTTVRRIMEDLYVTAVEPNRIRGMFWALDEDSERKNFLETMIEWSGRHKEAVLAATAQEMPLIFAKEEEETEE